jgi:NAD(P)-dependent dehydrogenase (short-subunit alcohol dehydrogenase family)
MNEKKSVLVTGAGSGVGRCIVDYLLLRGDRVFACDANDSNLVELDGREGVTTFRMDVRKRKTSTARWNSLLSRRGRLSGW